MKIEIYTWIFNLEISTVLVKFAYSLVGESGRHIGCLFANTATYLRCYHVFATILDCWHHGHWPKSCDGILMLLMCKYFYFSYFKFYYLSFLGLN